MGEGNVSLRRRPHTGRDTMLATAAAYQTLFGSDRDEVERGTVCDGDEPADTIEATFQIVYVIGWAPHESQPQPKTRGSQTAAIGDLTDFRDGADGGAAQGRA